MRSISRRGFFHILVSAAVAPITAKAVPLASIVQKPQRILFNGDIIHDRIYPIGNHEWDVSTMFLGDFHKPGDGWALPPVSFHNKYASQSGWELAVRKLWKPLLSDQESSNV